MNEIEDARGFFDGHLPIALAVSNETLIEIVLVLLAVALVIWIVRALR